MENINYKYSKIIYKLLLSNLNRKKIKLSSNELLKMFECNNSYEKKYNVHCFILNSIRKSFDKLSPISFAFQNILRNEKVTKVIIFPFINKEM